MKTRTRNAQMRISEVVDVIEAGSASIARHLRLPNRFAADAVVVVVEALRIGGKDGKAALGGDGATLREWWSGRNAGAIIGIGWVASRTLRARSLGGGRGDGWGRFGLPARR